MMAPVSAGSNTVSVAEDEAMRILLLMRNFLPAHEQSKNGEVGTRGAITPFPDALTIMPRKRS